MRLRGKRTAGPDVGRGGAARPSSFEGQADWGGSRLAGGRTGTLDLTRVLGGHSLLVAPGGRNAGRRDGPGESPSSPTAGVSCLTRGSRRLAADDSRISIYATPRESFIPGKL